MDSSNFCVLWRKTSHFHANKKTCLNVSMKTKNLTFGQIFSLLTSTDVQPGSIPGDTTSRRAEQSIDTRVDCCCCDRGSSIYLPNAAGIRRACQLFPSLLCAFSTHRPESRGQLAGSPAQRQPHWSIFEQPSDAWALHSCHRGPPFLALGQMPGHAAAVWGPLTEVIHGYQLEHPLIHYRWIRVSVGKSLHL